MSTGKLIKIALSLLVICAVTSGLVAAVYALTYDAIEAASVQAKQNAVKSIFAESDNIVEIQGTYPNSVSSVYRVEASGVQIGYAVDITSTGFGGDINMMVGFGTDMAVAGVSVIEHSETPGLGANIKNDSFLEQFKGISDQIVVGSNVDALSGATISSKAVAYGINEASQVVKGLEDEGK